MTDPLEIAKRNDGRPPVPGRVTVITAVYNAATTLRRCIESVLTQDYPDVEYILMDGGSTDESVDILKSYGDRIQWQSEPDQGIYDAWNKGIQRSSGEWIAFLGGDDFYLPGAIAAYMNSVKGKDVDYISSQVRWVASNSSSRILGGPWQWPRFQSLMTTAHVGSMHRSSLYKQYGFYDLSYRIVGDYELLLRPRHTLRTHFLPLLTVEMQAGGVSDTFAALLEATRAKIDTGGRSVYLSRLELSVARAKLMLRRAYKTLADRRAR